MVCPLRFVLLGASAAVALCGVVFVTHNKSKRTTHVSHTKVGVQVLLCLRRVKAIAHDAVALSIRRVSLTSPAKKGTRLYHVPDNQIMCVQDDTVWWRTLVDMLTGRYLWQAYLDWREHSKEIKVS